MNNNAIINSIVAAIPVIWFLISLDKLKTPAYKTNLIAFLIRQIFCLNAFKGKHPLSWE